MVLFATKLHVPLPKKRHIIYGSYKNFNEEHYLNDLSCMPLHVGQIFDDIDDTYWFVKSCYLIL